VNTPSHFVPNVPLITVPDRRLRVWPKKLIILLVAVPMLLFVANVIRGIRHDYRAATAKAAVQSVAKAPTNVPARSTSQPTPAIEPATSAGETLPGVRPLPVLAREATPPTAPQLSNDGYHVVRSGDTLSTLARTFGTSVKAIKSANGLSNERLTVGTRLRIPTQTPQPSLASAIQPQT
jgi:LysM repeat protein